MVNSTSFPLHVFEKDDWSMFLVESADKVLFYIEPIDFENNEYLFWDANGHGVRLTLQRGKLTKLEDADNEISLNEAFGRYSQTLGVTVDTTGTLAEVWARLQSNVKPGSRFSRTARNAGGLGCLSVLVIAVIFVLISFVGHIKTIFAR